MDIQQLERILQVAWIRETSADPDHWTPENPAWGQCAVTALVVDDHVGSRQLHAEPDCKVIWAEAVLPDGKKISHYFNYIDGREIDLSRKQFPPGTQIPRGVDKTKGFPTTRDYVLSYEATRNRYDLLSQRVADFLNILKTTPSDSS
jgi:hypothetical protein